MKNMSILITSSLFVLAAVSASVNAAQEEPLMAAVSRKAAADAAKVESAKANAKPKAKAVAQPKQTKKPPAVGMDTDRAIAIPKVAVKKAPAPTSEIEYIKEQEQIIEYANLHLQHLRVKDCVDCYVSSAGLDDSTLDMSDAEFNRIEQMSPKERELAIKLRDRVIARRECVDKWNDFYNKEPVDPANPDGPKKPVDIRIVLGYLDRDVDSFVGDRLIRQSMVKTLTEPCEANNLVQVCGFKQSVRDGDFFEKEVFGPKGEMQTVRVTLTASSASASDRLNKVEQERQSAVAEKVFNEGIRDADMLLYVGHARGGGGPDFRPAQRNERGATDLKMYQRDQPGLKALDVAFNNAKVNGQKKTPKIIGFLACDAEMWRERLERLAPKSGLLISADDKIETQATVAMAYLALDSVLWQRCPDEFNRAMNTLIDYRKKPMVPIALRRFFKRTN